MQKDNEEKSKIIQEQNTEILELRKTIKSYKSRRRRQASPSDTHRQSFSTSPAPPQQVDPAYRLVGSESDLCSKSELTVVPLNDVRHEATGGEGEGGGGGSGMSSRHASSAANLTMSTNDESLMKSKI